MKTHSLPSNCSLLGDPFDSSSEVFRQVPDHPAYYISNHGRVFSTKQGRFLRPFIAKRNFVQISLDGKSYHLHRLLAEVFLGRRPRYVYIEGDRTRPTLETVKWSVT